MKIYMSMDNERMVDRLDRFMHRRNLTDAELTRECRLAIGTIGKSRKPGKDITRRVAHLVMERYEELNGDWLLYGEGEMITGTPRERRYVYPLIDTAKAECGRPGGILDAVGAGAELPSIEIPGIPSDTEFFIQATGFSMVNDENPQLSIPPGAMVGVSKLLNGGFIRWGEVYMLTTRDGVMIKRVLQDADREYVVCASYNEVAYPPFRVQKSDIVDCARITCVIPVIVR